MKKIAVLFLALALLLTACGAPTPIVITATPEPVQATDVPAPTDVPATDVPAAAPTDTLAPAAATDTPAPAAVATDTPAPAAATNTPGAAATNTKPPAVGGDVFSDITRDIDAFSFKCSPSQIHLSLKSINSAITKVTVFYRVVSKDSAALPGAMITGPEMVSDKKGNFTLEFSALQINPDFRLANGWFDYQFVGLNKSGNVVGRSDKITQQVTFTLECP